MTATQTATARLYHPEMGEAADTSALFHAQYSHGGSYAIQWPAARENEALAAFKVFRISPRNIRSEKSGAYLSPFKGDIFVGLVTDAAYRKLHDSRLSCTAMLLD